MDIGKVIRIYIHRYGDEDDDVIERRGWGYGDG